MVLNSKFFGVPQNRERVFIIGSLRGEPKPEILPFRECCGETKGLVYAQKSDREIARIYDPKGIAPTLHLKTGGWQEPKIVDMIKQIATKRNFETPKEINQFLKDNKNNSIGFIAESLDLPKTQVEHYFRTDKSRAIPSPEIWWKLKKLLNLSATYDKEVTDIYNKEVQFEQNRRVWDTTCSPTINATSEGHLIAQSLQTDGQLRQGSSWGTDKPQSARNIRRLTPTECERLQGFPDGWTEGVSDTQRYKQMGNAVTVNVIQAIAEKLLK